MVDKIKMEEILKAYPQYRDALFCRGYLITDDFSVNKETYPFYDQWNVEKVKNFRLFIHQNQDYTLYEDNDIAYLIIGHAYNPFNMVYDENILLKQCAEAYTVGKPKMFECINEWTGIFALYIFDKNVLAVQDCAGIKSVYYGNIGGKTIFTSHPQLIADLYDLKMDPFISELVSNRYYNIGNRYLPGNLSPFKELRRIGANVYLEETADGEIHIQRFFPVMPHPELVSEKEYDESIEKAFNILHNGIELATKKWDNAYISLSGGTDSKTTLACANGCYDKLSYYSFQSKDTEIVDSEAAHRICDKIGLTHKIYKIQSENEQVEDFDILKEIIYHSFGYVRGLADHEVRKHIYFYRQNEIGVEIKSWISEIVRVFFDRKYGMTMPEKLTPRHFSIFQTRYFLSPSLLKKSDAIYKQYMKEFDLEETKFNYEHTDLYYWEVRMSSWGMMVTTSLDICHRITFPFNNRKLIELLLSLPREKRLTDEMHNDIIKFANKDIYDMGVHIKNNYFKSKRIWLEKIYYYYRILFYRDK